MKNQKLEDSVWIELWIKPKYSKHEMRELVGIYYYPYGCTIKRAINDWILPEFRHQVYGIKTH